MSGLEVDNLTMEEEAAAIGAFYSDAALILNAAEDDEIADCDFFCKDEMIPFSTMCRIARLEHLLELRTAACDVIAQFSRESRKTIHVIDGILPRFSVDPDGTMTA